MNISNPQNTTAWTPVRAILAGALTVGSLDALDAIVFFGLRGARPARIFQSIASGLLGPAAFRGGIATVALGVVIHFTIAGSIVACCVIVSRYLSVIRRRPLLCGPLYGIAVYAFMNLVVVPASAANRGALTLPVFLNGILIHMLGVGLPSALFAATLRRR